jgi:hypothetical protein
MLRLQGRSEATLVARVKAPAMLFELCECVLVTYGRVHNLLQVADRRVPHGSSRRAARSDRKLLQVRSGWGNRQPVPPASQRTARLPAVPGTEPPVAPNHLNVLAGTRIEMHRGGLWLPSVPDDVRDALREPLLAWGYRKILWGSSSRSAPPVPCQVTSARWGRREGLDVQAVRLP